VIHGHASVETAEKKLTEIADLEGTGYEVRIVRSSDGRDTAQMGNLRKKRRD
jgi:hypothetical protein